MILCDNRGPYVAFFDTVRLCDLIHQWNSSPKFYMMAKFPLPNNIIKLTDK